MFIICLFIIFLFGASDFFLDYERMCFLYVAVLMFDNDEHI